MRRQISLGLCYARSNVSSTPYGLGMAWQRTYTDEQLIDAIARSTSWRGTLRELGLVATSAGAMKSVRSRADHLAIDRRHFTGQRRWTDEQLRLAVATAQTWPEVASALGLSGGSAVATLKGHAVRLGLDTAHFATETRVPMTEPYRPHVINLARAGSLLAAAWFTLCGHEVSWPLEPARYDLLVGTDLGVRRVQVKTATTRDGISWQAYLSTTTRHERRTYDPDEIDDFFVIDGDLSYYLIPLAAVGGLHTVRLAAYGQYRVPAAW